MYSATPAERVTVSTTGTVELLATETLDENPPAARSKRAPSATALPEASRAVTVAVTFSPADGVGLSKVIVTVFAVVAPTSTSIVFLIVASVQAAVSQRVIVALPDLTPSRVCVVAAPAGTITTDVSEETACTDGAAVTFAALSAPVTVRVSKPPTAITLPVCVTP